MCVGLMNIQFAVKDGEVYLIEVNPRASRTVPFVAKAIGAPIAKIAARVMAGEKLKDLPPINLDIDYIAVKEAVFPFDRFPGVDPVLSPEMKSTGEVMGIDKDFATAFAKAQIGAGMPLPMSGKLFVSVKDSDKPVIAARSAPSHRMLGFDRLRDRRHGGLSGSRRASRSNASTRSRKAARISSTRSRTAKSQLIFNTTEGWQSLKDSEEIRRSALVGKVSQYTTAAGSVAAAQAIAALQQRELEVRPLQDYY